MSKYTTQIRFICEIYGRKVVESWFKDYNLEDYLTPEEIGVIELRGTWNKDKLAEKIVDHYFMREIGFDTPALFKHYVKVTMQEIMESKLPLIYSASIKYDPMVNVDFTETYEQEHQDNDKSNGSSTNNGSSLSVNSDTPQGQISKSEILQGKFASQTGASEGTNTTTDESNTNRNGTLKSTRTQRGNSGALTTGQGLIKQYRDIIISVDKDIINELNQLFIGIY